MPRLELDILIFDIDGVLIDVSASYRDAIRQTAQLYLETALRLKPYEGELVSHEDVAAFKLAGGFNNDWDLTTGILMHLLALIPPAPASSGRLPMTTSEALAYLGELGFEIPITVAELVPRKEIQAFIRQVAAAGGGLSGAYRVLGTHNAALLFARGDLRSTNLGRRIFEEVYLGEDYFRDEYGEAPLVFHGPGLIRREHRITSPQTLHTLAARMALGVATGRPRNQARFALETAGIAQYFSAMVTHEDIVAAEARGGAGVQLGKPHPFTLLEAVRRITSEPARCAYIGDTLDDIRAANAAKAEMSFFSIGCLAPAGDKPAMRKEFERVGADVVIEHADELVELLAKQESPRT